MVIEYLIFFVCCAKTIFLIYFFNQAANDGLVKIWDCMKFEGRNVANRSRHTYNRLVLTYFTFLITIHVTKETLTLF